MTILSLWSMKKKMKKTFNIPLSYEQNYFTNECKDYDQIILALHGYQLNGEFMYKRISRTLDLSKTLIISPNAPFLVPVKTDNGYIDGYSWYFFDSQKKSFYVNYEPAAQLMNDLLNSINTKEKPIHIIGYSQGGYLSPRIAQLNKNVKKVYGIACIFRKERFELKEDCEYFQIHGTKDTLVDYQEAKDEFLSLGLNTNNFHDVETKHLLASDLLEKLKEVYE